ncbi:MAG TPA: hypothetical protein VKA68_05940 [bacterium]|nr:hypothetical protein [bacterium]
MENKNIFIDIAFSHSLEWYGSAALMAVNEIHTTIAERSMASGSE